MKILPVEAEFSIRTNGQIDMRNLLVAFGNFVKATKNLRQYGNKTGRRTKTAKEYESLFLYVLGSPSSNLDIEPNQARN
jgi:hypothetical protein